MWNVRSNVSSGGPSSKKNVSLCQSAFAWNVIGFVYRQYTTVSYFDLYFNTAYPVRNVYCTFILFFFFLSSKSFSVIRITIPTVQLIKQHISMLQTAIKRLRTFEVISTFATLCYNLQQKRCYETSTCVVIRSTNERLTMQPCCETSYRN